MKVSDYERGTHNCLEHPLRTLDTPELWRCNVCLNRIPRPSNNTQTAFNAYCEETNTWFKSERCKYKWYISDYKYRALWNSNCPECEGYIRESQSWIVELMYPHTNTETRHRSTGEHHDVTGRYVHWRCYQEILRRRPCFYCGETPAGTVDHIVARAHGGADEPFNIVAACTSCNSSKGTRNQTVHQLHKAIPELPDDDWLAA